MFKQYFEYIGLCKNEYPKKRETYVPAKEIDIAREYLTYLQGVNATRDARQNTIESKTSQIIGQTSIVISVVSLFIPLFADKLNELNTFVKWSLLTLFVTLIFHFILATLHALKNLQIEKSKFMEGSTTTITKETRACTELEFINIQIDDLVKIINHNNSLTNRAAAGLVYASRNFKIGIGSFLMFICALLLCFTTVTKTSESIRIDNMKELNIIALKQIFKLEKEIEKLKISVDSLQSVISHQDIGKLKSKIITIDPLLKK